MHRDSAHVARLAAAIALDLGRRSPGPARGLARLGRGLQRAGQGLSRRVRVLAREHWDVAAFDVVFGSLKAFGVYPALYFAGLAWTIPLMEYAPLNTQLWTAGYLLARRKLLSAWGRRRYGVSLERLDALRDGLLGHEPRDAQTLHRFRWQGRPLRLRVRRSRWIAWRERRRGAHPAPGLVTPSELRNMVSDPGFVHLANPLRGNPFLYERVLIQRILANPAERPRLLARAAPDAGPAETDAALRSVFGDGPEPTCSRIDAQTDRVAAGLRAQLGSARSLPALGLRWLHASHRRALRRMLAELRDAEYRLLADVAGGRPLAESPYRVAVRAKRGAIRAHLARATKLAERIAGVRSTWAARRLLRAGLREARSSGLAARRAGLALRWDAAGPLAALAGMAGPARIGAVGNDS